jgi:hypothetical protein
LKIGGTKILGIALIVLQKFVVDNSIAKK